MSWNILLELDHRVRIAMHCYGCMKKANKHVLQEGQNWDKAIDGTTSAIWEWSTSVRRQNPWVMERNTTEGQLLLQYARPLNNALALASHMVGETSVKQDHRAWFQNWITSKRRFKKFRDLKRGLFSKIPVDLYQKQATHENSTLWLILTSLRRPRTFLEKSSKSYFLSSSVFG